MSKLSELTKRESEVVALIAQGYRDREIAEYLALSVCTVRNHVRRILCTLEVSNRTSAAQVYWQESTLKND